MWESRISDRLQYLVWLHVKTLALVVVDYSGLILAFQIFKLAGDINHLSILSLFIDA